MLKNKINKLIFILTLLIFIINFTACSPSYTSPIDLISKPKLNVDDSNAIDLINENLPLSAQTIRPLKPGLLKSVGYFNIDKENTKAAYAFYKSKETGTIGVILLKNNNSKWNVFEKIEISGLDIIYAEFKDLNSDGITDIIIGAKKDEESYGTVNAYIYQEEEYKLIWSDVFTELLIEDFNNDSYNEIICLKHDRSQFSSISMYSYKNGKIELLDELEMDLYIGGYYSSKIGKISKGKKALFLDFDMGSMCASNIITLDNNKLKPVFYINQSQKAYSISQKYDKIKSKDTNSDGLFEFASNYKLIYSGENNIKNKGVYAWKQYDETRDSFNTVAISYIDQNLFYEFVFPPSWVNASKKGQLSTVTSSSKHKRNFISFYYVTESQDMFEILSFEYFDKEDYKRWKESEIANYYETIELSNVKQGVLLAYFNKIEPTNEESYNIYKSLKLDKTQIIDMINFVK